MANTQNNNVSRLEIAALRLERAMQKVEIAIDSKENIQKESQLSQQGQISSLQQENNHLQEINQKVTSRIDSTIDKLSRLLEG